MAQVCRGSYRARNLDLTMDDLTQLRSQIVCATIKSFQPDLVIFDNVARGGKGSSIIFGPYRRSGEAYTRLSKVATMKSVAILL